MLANRGFTLVEMLVVLLIIGILIGIMLPQVQSAITRTKEKVTINQVKAIEMALQEYAGKNRRCFPGSAIDIMAPFPYYSLGDGNFVQDGNNLNGPPKLPSANTGDDASSISIGLLGGAVNRAEIERVRSLTIQYSGESPVPSPEPRWFDVLAASGAVSRYPMNQFRKGAGASNPIYNVFRYEGAIIDFTSEATLFGSLQSINPYLLVPPRQAEVGSVDDNGFVRLTFPNYALYSPEADADNYFAEGDFAYVPILSLSPFAHRNDLNTPGEDQRQWSTLATEYMIFAYGARGNKNDIYADERIKFRDEGLPQFGGVGADTPFEDAVLSLFNGAIYYNRVKAIEVGDSID